MSRTTLIAVYELLSGTSAAGGEGLAAPLAAGVRLANVASAALDGEEGGAVAGARQSTGNAASLPGAESPVSYAGPSP